MAVTDRFPAVVVRGARVVPGPALVAPGGRLVPARGGVLPRGAGLLTAAPAAGRGLVPALAAPVPVVTGIPVVPAVPGGGQIPQIVPAIPVVPATAVVAPDPIIPDVPVVDPAPVTPAIPVVTPIPQIVTALQIVTVPDIALIAGGRVPVVNTVVNTVVVTARTGRTLISIVAARPGGAAAKVRPSRRIHDGEVGFVEVDAQLGPVEVDVVEVVADQVVDVGVHRHEVGFVEPAGPRRVEGGFPLPPGRELVLGHAAAAARRHDGVRYFTLGVVPLLNDRRTRHDRVLVVLVGPVFVVLVAHDEAPNRPGENPPPRCRMEATVLTLYHLRTPVPAPRAPDQRLPRGGCGRLTTDLRSAPPHRGPPSPAARTLREPRSHRRRSSPEVRDHPGIRPESPPGSMV
ncbi:hypothetical protein SAMN04489716_0320 [Actinoplanes derwentensis]|uniref:Uncharacterized protein n=1 Tax=Actinoplanes derwentensis TaxID=113562 RepID=A0A1H1QJG0_9ACTN|nr:hypothetical protein SAMN04489716_0320 [Actinoplanes derwentensis]